jgi:hypothetical protein
VEASQLLANFADRYPIAVSRDLQRAKQWILSRARGTERYGIVASSKAHRLKPDAIDIQTSYPQESLFFYRIADAHAKAIETKIF